MAEEKRICRKHGGDPLPLSDFPRNKNAPGGIDKMCKTCWKNRPKKTFAGAGSTAKKSKSKSIPVPEVLPTTVEYVELAKLSKLPGDRKLFEWSGSVASGLATCMRLFGGHGPIVYTYKGNRHWV